VDVTEIPDDTAAKLRLASEWFDQFEPWLAEHPEVDGRGQWCRRHWAPCPAIGANGIGATIEMITRWRATLPPNLTSAAAMSRAAERASPLCCTIGDILMYEIWAHWPPAEGSAHGSS
jgi:hypothetical protein